MGTPDFAVPTLNALYDSGYDVAAVFTQPDKPKGRGMKLAPSPVKAVAEEHNTLVYQPGSFRGDGGENAAILREIAPDCIVVAAYGKILPPEILSIAPLGCVNVHGSLLPKYRGAAPIQRAVLDGEKITGITTMLMGEGLDTGDILLQEQTQIGENETSAQLFERLAVMGAALLIKTLAALESSSVTPRKQDDSQATYAHMITKDMSPIDFTQSAQKIHRQICGLSDYPCASAILNGKRLKIYSSEIVSTQPTGRPVGSIVNAKDFSVACGSGVIRFTQVQAEGSKKMSAQDYLRGKPLCGSEILG